MKIVVSQTFKPIRTDTLVVGAGLAGLSTAYHLARSGIRDVLIIERESKVGMHASGKNAAMIRQALADPILAKMAKRGRRALVHAQRSGWKGMKLTVNGSLFLADLKDVKELNAMAVTMRQEGVACRWLSRSAAVRKVPVLKQAVFDRVLFCPSDAMLNLRELFKGFLNQFRSDRINILFNTPLRQARKESAQFVIRAGEWQITCRVMVNAAGGWAGEIAQAVGGLPIPLAPCRRHIYKSFPVRAEGLNKWPFVWNLSHHVYFRPDGSSLLLSPCDQERIPSLTVKTDPRMRRFLDEKLRVFGDGFQSLRIRRADAALRTLTPDGRFVIGEDPRIKNFFWVAGLGGHGVTSCFSVGKLASDLIVGKKVDGQLAGAFSPGRFV